MIDLNSLYNYFIDVDGVIIDSQDRFLMDMKDNTDFNDWMDYLNSIDWYKFLRECDEIDESFWVLKKLQELKKLKAIITTIHGSNEMKEKLIYIREKEIYVPVLFVPPKTKKCDIYLPSKWDVLVDDKIRNCIDWENAGGKSLLFDSHIEKPEKNKIKTLKQLL